MHTEHKMSVYITTVLSLTFKHLSLKLSPLGLSMKRFNQNINTGSKLSSSKLLNFTCTLLLY